MIALMASTVNVSFQNPYWVVKCVTWSSSLIVNKCFRSLPHTSRIHIHLNYRFSISFVEIRATLALFQGIGKVWVLSMLLYTSRNSFGITLEASLTFVSVISWGPDALPDFSLAEVAISSAVLNSSYSCESFQRFLSLFQSGKSAV